MPHEPEQPEQPEESGAPRDKPKARVRWPVWAGAALLLVALTAGGLVTARNWLLNQPGGGAAKEVLVVIPRGAGVQRIAAILKKKRVLAHADRFVWAAYAWGRGRTLKSGEYRLSGKMSHLRILQVIASGKPHLHKVTVPEGFTMAEIARRLEAKGLAKASRVAALCRDARFVAGLKVPQENLEGYLYPDTYHFPRDIGAKGALKAMVRRFFREWSRITGKKPLPGMGLRQAVILASIIEAEAKVPGERPLISAVYHNRLKIGMRLQADPTVAYGLEVEGRLTKKHLATPNPYNTYLHAGLPPGPICSPGGASLRAALNPAPVKYLYFVAVGDGSHRFSRTYRGQMRAVRQYRRNRHSR